MPRHPFDAAYIPGGSSSGSAVAVSAGLVSFALRTDTAGSGRVPAAFCNVIGLKPTRGLISTAGVVPACRSLDCVSIFALTVDDAAAVLSVAAGPDADDAYVRVPPQRTLVPRPLPAFRFGLPDQLDFVGDQQAAHLFDEAVTQLEVMGSKAVEINFSPFVNLLDLSAIAVSVGFRSPGIPMGITFIAPAFHNERLLDLAWEFYRRTGLPLGVTSHITRPEAV